MRAPSLVREVNAFSTLPFAVVSYGTRRPTQFVPPTKWRESSCARCSTPSGVGTPRLIVSPERSANAFSAGRASSTRLSPASRCANRTRTGPGATRRSRARWRRPRRSSAPTSREVVDFGRPALADSSETPSGRGDSTTLTSSSAARSIAWVPASAISPYGGTPVPRLSSRQLRTEIGPSRIQPAYDGRAVHGTQARDPLLGAGEREPAPTRDHAQHL